MKSLLFKRKLGVLVITALVAGGILQPNPTNAAKRWDWPMKPARLSAGFDRPAQNWLPGHRGIDLVGRSGDKVFAAGNGVVTFAGTLAGKGVIVINHGKLRTTYEPVTASVVVGSQVKVGELIGILSPGESHCASKRTANCLHWGLIQGEKYLNPLMLVKKPVRLLPRV